MIRAISRILDRRRVAKHRERCRIEAEQRLAADVERRKKSEEVISFNVRRKQALRSTRGELA